MRIAPFTLPSKSHLNRSRRVMGATGSGKTTVSRALPVTMSINSPDVPPVHQSRERFKSERRNGPDVLYGRCPTRERVQSRRERSDPHRHPGIRRHLKERYGDFEDYCSLFGHHVSIHRRWSFIDLPDRPPPTDTRKAVRSPASSTSIASRTIGSAGSPDGISICSGNSAVNRH